MSWKYRLPLRLAAICLLMLALTVMALGAVGAFYGLDQGYYERDMYDYFDSPACRNEAWRLVRDLRLRLSQSPADWQAELGKLATNACITAVWPDGTVLQNGSPEGKIFFEQTFEGTPAVTVALTGALPLADGFYFGRQVHQLLYNNRNGVFALLVGGLMAAAALTTYLCVAAGRDYRDGHLRPGLIDAIPLDLLLVGEGLLVLLTVPILGSELQLYRAWGLYLAVIFCWVLLLVLTIMTIAARAKLHTLWRNTLVWWCISKVLGLLGAMGRKTAAAIRAVPTIWRGAALWGAILVAQLVLWPVLPAVNILLFFLGLLLMAQLKRFHVAGQALAAGDVEHKVDTKGLFWEMRDHAENLNSAAEGMAAAVARQTKSERLKTELITNVSHDIKTPLTSIVSYVDLLQKPHTPEQQGEYLEVLDRQAKRLKKLTEDLVEASKASTGNIAAELMPTNLSELLEQALAEYAGRLEAGRLQLVTDLPPQPLSALADGRLLWRVLDNLLANVCKYALPETRVYAGLERSGEKARITVKNISREALNISPDELTERFVRGDRARRTEGSGLGLNIARSLVELQRGDFRLEIDGDLFKAVVELPLAPELTEAVK